VKPPVLPDATRPELDHATCYVSNVYADLPGVEQGQVKGIRLLQMMRWYKEVGQQGLQWHPIQNPSWAFGYGTCAPVRVIGTVPVEADGSAHFQVPAETDVYFQAIDANGMALQRMRTHVEFARGEFRSCIGCHETRSSAITSQAASRGLALAKPAARPVPPPWGDTRPMGFERLIQPILAAKCLSCHGGDKTEAGLDLSATKDEHGFMQSFRSMFGLKKSDPTPGVFWGAEPGKKPASVKSPKTPWWEAMRELVTPRSPTDGSVTQVKQFGAWQMPLILAIIKDPKHRQRLTDEEMQTLACWADVMAPYFDTYVRQAGKGLERVFVTLPPPFARDQHHIVEEVK
jgi:hypothetical protein